MVSYANMMREAHASSLPADGARALLECAQRKGWQLAVVTSAERRWALEWLARNDLSNWINVVVGGDDVTRGKPSPEPYRLALARTRCEAERSLAVEDSRTGARAATAAGVRTCVIAPATDRRDWPSGVTFISRLSEAMEML